MIQFISRIFSLVVISIALFSCNKNKPSACFTTDKDVYKIYDTVIVSNCSKNFTDIEWSYSNGAKIQTNINPKIYLIDTGNFSIQLTVGKDNFKTSSIDVKNLQVTGL